MMNLAGTSVNIHHNIKVTFQEAESSVCTAAHPKKYFGIFDFIREDRRPSLRPTHPSIQWATEALFRSIKWPGLIQMGTHWHMHTAWIPPYLYSS